MGVNEITVLDRSIPSVYTLPDCHKCEILKEWLYKNGYEFNTRPFDTEAQTEFIMMNMFGNPPILQFSDRIVSAEDIFPNDKIDEMKIYEVLSIDEA